MSRLPNENSQLDPDSLAAQCVAVLIGCLSFIADSLPARSAKVARLSMSSPSRFEVASWTLERPPTGICFSPAGVLHAYDGRTIYTGNAPGFNEVRHFSVSEPERSREGHCRFMNGGKSILLIASDDNSEEGIHHVTVRDLVTNELTVDANLHFEHYGLMTILFNRGETELLLTDCGGTSHFVDFPSCIRTRSVKFDAETFGGRGAACGSKLFSPAESELWEVCGYDEPSGYREYLAAFEVGTGRGVRRQQPNNGDHIDGLQLTPSCDVLLAVEENALCLRDPRSWGLLRKIDLVGSLRKGWGRSRPAMAFAPNSPLVALSCEYNMRVCIADYEAAKLIGVFDVDEEFCVRLLSFSPNRRYLAIASYDVQNEVRVWDVSKVQG
jgi:WD40 repeat protein